MKARVWSGVFLIMVVFLTPVPNAGRDHIRTFAFENIGHFDSILTIFQDRAGFLWIGGDRGLGRYDGYSFKFFQPFPEDQTKGIRNRISDIQQDSEGNLWLATGIGIGCYDPQTGDFSHWEYRPENPADPKPGSPTCLHLDEDGAWIGWFRAGLLRFDIEKETFARYPLGTHLSSLQRKFYNDQNINQILGDQQGCLWLATQGGGLQRFDPRTESFAVYKPDPDRDGAEYPGNLITCLHRDRAGRLWLGTRFRGLKRFDPVSETFTSYPPGRPAVKSSAQQIMSLSEDPRRGLLIGTWERGLYWFDQKTETFDPVPIGEHYFQSINLNYLSRIYRDSRGKFWIGTLWGGELVKFDPKNEHFSNYLIEIGDTGFTRIKVWCILEDQRENLWLGTADHGLIRYRRDRGTVAVYSHDPADAQSISSNSVGNLCEDASGDLWVCTGGGSLCRFHPATGTFRRFSFPADQVPMGRINSITPAPDGKIWLGTHNGVYRFDPTTGNLTPFYRNSIESGYSLNNVVLVLKRDTLSRLWIGTGRDLVCYDPNRHTFKEIRGGDGSSPISYVRVIFEDRWRNLWIGTQGNGLFQVEPSTGRITRFSRKKELPDNTVVGILQDDSGILWITTYNGICQLDPRTGRCQVFPKGTGLTARQFTKACWRCRDGELLFGHPKGFSGFFPENIAGKLPASGTVITDIQNLSQPETRPIFFPAETTMTFHHNESLSISFSNLSYRPAAQNRYRYRVEGLNPRWTDLGSKNTVTFPYLPPGSYVFEVKGADGGDTRKPARLGIRIIPPFWSTWWFRIPLVLLIAGAGFAGYRRRVKKIESRYHHQMKMKSLLLEKGISSREEEIIRLLLKGLSNREIENQLFISPHTVKNHIYHIYQKLEVDNRTELKYILSHPNGPPNR